MTMTDRLNELATLNRVVPIQIYPKLLETKGEVHGRYKIHKKTSTSLE